MEYPPSNRAFGDAAWALACGGLLAVALERPWVAAATVACTLLPPWAAAIRQAWQCSADITLALDPHAPNPDWASRAFRAAATRAGTTALPVTLGLFPLYDIHGKTVPIRLELTRDHALVCRVGPRRSRPLPAETWLPYHPLPVTVEHVPTLIRFSVAADRRIATRLVLPLRQRTRLLAHAALGVVVLPFSGPAALAAVVAGLLAVARRDGDQ